MTKAFRLLPWFLLPTWAAFAQGVGIGTTSPDASAVLEVRSTSQGLLPPRLSQTQRDAIASPAAGLVVYQTDNAPGLYVYSGTGWVSLGADNLGNHTATQNLNLAGYQLVGNGGSQGLRISRAGNVGLGTASPVSLLSNTAGNIIGSDNSGVGANSLTWTNADAGYAGAFYNSSTGGGLAVKVGAAAAPALDVSQGSSATAGTPLLRVQGNGQVGIGTVSPGQELEMAGQPAPTLLLHSSGNNLVTGATLQLRESDTGYGWNLRHNNGGSEGGNSDDRLVLERLNGAAASPVMAWNQTSGNVGIGTTTPAYALDVAGTASISTSVTTPALLTPATGAHNMAAVAYGSYGITNISKGNFTIGLITSSGNVQVTHPGPGHYTLAITGPSSQFLLITCTVGSVGLFNGGSGGLTSINVAGGNNIYINSFNPSTNTVSPVDADFSFVVYQP